jgi:hypothetical protein
MLKGENVSFSLKQSEIQIVCQWHWVGSFPVNLCTVIFHSISEKKTLVGFREGHFNVLIATNVVARGLDIPTVDLFIHYELPTTSEIFAHGGESIAYTVIDSSLEIKILFVLLKLVRITVMIS